VPVATAGDLIALKLYAGGPQDAWDVEHLLQTGDRAALGAASRRCCRRCPRMRAASGRVSAGRGRVAPPTKEADDATQAGSDRPSRLRR
jgi:hypothetical protein